MLQLPTKGKIEFTWQQVMIGIQSSIIMFPINLLIVSIFRNIRPREQRTDQTPKQSKSDSGKQANIGRVSPTQPPSPQSDHREITPDAVIKVHKSTMTIKKIFFFLPFYGIF